MINNITVPEYKEILPMICLDDSHHLNGNVVDDASLEVMLRIEKEMQRLKVMGSDERRTLWLEIHLPGRGYQWEEDRRDRNGNIWYWITTANYEGFHYLIFCDGCFRIIDLRSHTHVHGERDSEHHTYADVRKPLLRLERYVKDIVDAICETPAAYNEYVEQNLPYWKKHGTIPRSVLNSICPMYRRVADPESEIELLENVRKSSLTVFDEMTLNVYMHYWRLAYVAYMTRGSFEPKASDYYDGFDDRELFTHSSKGTYELEGLSLDSQEDFIKWERENSPYHCLDVAYARIHLWPVRDEDSEKWHFELGYHVGGYFRDVLNIVRALYEQGVVIGIRHWVDEALEQLREEDVVGVCPSPNKYREEISVPYVGDGVTRKMVNAIVRATTWKKEEEALPL